MVTGTPSDISHTDAHEAQQAQAGRFQGCDQQNEGPPIPPEMTKHGPVAPSARMWLGKLHHATSCAVLGSLGLEDGTVDVVDHGQHEHDVADWPTHSGSLSQMPSKMANPRARAMPSGAAKAMATAVARARARSRARSRQETGQGAVEGEG